MPRVTIALCIASAAAAANAQIRLGTEPPRAPGDSPGDAIAGPFDWQAMTGGNAVLGVEFAWGHYWVSFRNADGPASAPVVGRPHRIAKFRPDGPLVAVFDQACVYDPAPGPSTSPWGGRDGAADEAGNRLYFGREGGRLDVYSFDPQTGRISAKTGRTIAGLEGQTIRALCFREGTGRFVTANFAGPLREFTLSGGVTATYANTLAPGGGAAKIYGLAWIEAPAPRLWAWAQGGVPEAMALEAIIAPGAITSTGLRFQATLFPGQTRSVAGGADITCHNGAVALAAVHQGSSDHAALYDTGGTCGGGGCPCACDFDTATGRGVCDIFDFLAFQNAYTSIEPCACDLDTATGPGVCDIFDFLAFQNAFVVGCP